MAQDLEGFLEEDLPASEVASLVCIYRVVYPGRHIQGGIYTVVTHPGTAASLARAHAREGILACRSLLARGGA